MNIHYMCYGATCSVSGDVQKLIESQGMTLVKHIKPLCKSYAIDHDEVSRQHCCPCSSIYFCCTGEIQTSRILGWTLVFMFPTQNNSWWIAAAPCIILVKIYRCHLHYWYCMFLRVLWCLQGSTLFYISHIKESWMVYMAPLSTLGIEWNGIE